MTTMSTQARIRALLGMSAKPRRSSIDEDEEYKVDASTLLTNGPSSRTRRGCKETAKTSNRET